ncbi:MAG: T9SS type A sorting domain-containing protein [Candidatus Kapabacteria bacterium]|nr:T9SS type A sorting domain-containing protein [Candidatus Kapabacteria bacterium]
MRTTDGGTTWKRSVNGPYRDLIGNPTSLDVLYASTYVEQGGAKISRSTDAGITWTDVRTFPSAERIRLAVTKANANVVGAVASEAGTHGLEGIYKSTDAGVTFAELPTSLNLLNWRNDGVRQGQNGNNGQGFYDLSMAFSPTSASQFYVGGVNLWRTTNDGRDWVLSAEWTGNGAPWVHADQHYLKFHPTQNVLIATHDGGVARSTDKGVSWRDISNGLRVQQYYGLATSNINPSLTIMGAQDNGTALTTNSGSTFKHTLDGDGMLGAIDYINPSTMYASQYAGQFYRTQNQGVNWAFSSNAQQRGENMAAWAAPIAADPQNQDVAYIGYGQIYRTTSGGVFWERISQIPTSEPSRVISVAPSNSSYIYIAYSTALWYTTNGGTDWTQQSGISSVIMGIEVDPADPKKIYVALGGYSAGSKVVQVSNGIVSNISGTGLPNVPCTSLSYQNGPTKRLYAGTDLGVFFTDIGSNFWQPYGTGMPAAPVTAMRLVTTSNILRVSTFGRGIWEIDVRQCTATKPTITAITSTTKCAGDSVVLEASSGFAAYRWTNGDTTRRIALKTVSQTGPYTVSVEDNSGCRNTSSATTVTILQPPSKPNISQRGKDTLRSSTVGGITVFQWYRGGVAIPGATSRDLFTQVSGQYSVRAENAAKCTTMSNEFAFVFDPNTVEDVAAGRAIGIYPNPADDHATITMPSVSGRTIDVVDLTGRTVFSTSIADGIGEYQLNLTSYARGAYIVRVRSASSVWMARLVR